MIPSEDGTQARIKGIAAGTAYVVAQIQGVGRIIIPIEVHEHRWGVPSYTWADNKSTCTATRICEYDSTHVETETVTPTLSGTTLTATFANPAFEPQQKTVSPSAAKPSDTGQERTGSGTTSGNRASSGTATTRTSSTTTARTGDAALPLTVAALLGAGACLLLARRKALRARHPLHSR